jgi:flagellar basal body P-ring formation protein FlgA
MKQVSNSLLTLYPIHFKLPEAPAIPRDIAGVNGRHLTPFFVHRRNAGEQSCILPDLSCPPRCNVRSRLGEGRIRSLLHGISCFFLTAWMLLAPARMLTGAESVTIRLKEEAAVRSPMVFLKDVADLQGAESNRLRVLEQITLGQAPAFGAATVLSRHQIQERIESEADSLAGVNWTGAAAVQVRLQGRPADFNDVAPVLKSHLDGKTLWAGSEIKIRSIVGLKGIELPPEAFELRVSSNTTLAGRNRILAPVEIWEAGKIMRCFWITAEISVRSAILIASQKIPLQKIITPDDVVETVTELPDLRAAYARHPEDLIGKASRRSFSAGDPLTREAFSDPILVRHGETVRVRLERNGIVLTSMAKAEQDGKLGQVISVRNLESSAPLKAQVTGRAAVKMQ